MKRWVTTIALCVACSGREGASAAVDTTQGAALADSSPMARAPIAASPFAAHALPESERIWLDGKVEERLDAGSYVYLRVRTPAEPAIWVASLAATTPVEPLVRVLVLGRAEQFQSRRLAREFNPLVFGLVRAATSPLAPTSKGIDP